MERILLVFLWPSELAASIAAWAFVAAVIIAEVLR